MNIKIGAKIKDLRRENNVTQDTLAAAIGVTPQAVSRWEAETGYPDIELLPSLADFFSVSVDELVGYRLSDREEKLSRVKSELNRLSEVGSAAEQLEYARLAASQFPTDCEIKCSLATSLYLMFDNTEDGSVLSEAESLCTYVIENCKVYDTRYDAVSTLFTIYSKTNRPHKALELTEELIPMKYCREFLLSEGTGDGKTELYIQDEISKLTDCLGTAIWGLCFNEDLPNDPSTWEKKIVMMETSSKLYLMIYGEDLMFYHTRLAFNYFMMSTYQMALGREADALDSLEKMCHHATQYDLSYSVDHDKYYTSIFTDKIIYPEPSNSFHELTEHSQSYYMLEKLANPRYASVKDTERFKAVVEKLTENTW